MPDICTFNNVSVYGLKIMYVERELILVFVVYLASRTKTTWKIEARME
jgi:hypothetical protein